MPEDDQILHLYCCKLWKKRDSKANPLFGISLSFKKFTCLGLFTPMFSVLNYLVSLPYMCDNSVLLTVGLALVLRAIL